jgi:hypothetical protein
MADFKSAKADLIPPSIAPVRREAPRDIAPGPKGVRFGRAPQQTPGNQYLATTAHSPPTPAAQPIRFYESVMLPKAGLDTTTSVPAKAAPLAD